jgi:hypothetical protein
MNRTIRLYLGLLLLVAGTTIACDDNPVDEHGHLDCDHFEAEGFDLVAGGSALHTQFQGAVSGTVTVNAGATITTVEVLWLDTDSLHIVPGSSCDQSLRFDIDDDDVIGIQKSPGNPWALDITGKQVGTTTFRVMVFHVDHADFTSLPIPVTVTTALADTIAPPSLVIMDGEDAIATHNFDESNGPGAVTGPVVLSLGETRAALEAWFVDGPQRPVDGARERVVIPDGHHSLAWSVADPSLVEVTANAASPWHFDMIPRLAGATTVRFQLMFEGSPRYTSGDIPVLVTALQPTDAGDDYSLKKNGVWNVIINAGVVQTTHCRSANPGRFEVGVGELSDLYFLKFIDDACKELSASGWDVQFLFADDGIARSIHHPFHWNEKDEFHVMGVAAGQTTVRLYLIRNGTVQIVSPPIEVVVST